MPAVHSSNKEENCLRVVRRSYQTVNNKAKEILTVTDNFWYQDSIGITQFTGVQAIQRDSVTSFSTILLGYRLIDMRKNWIYEYRTLSDTAAIVRKYDKAHSIAMEMAGGWNFYRAATIQFDSLRLAGDTNINGIHYKKYRLVQLFQGRRLQGEVLARCDKKGAPFFLDVGISNAIGCPMVKGSSLTSDGRFPTSSVEIEFLANTFPDSVKRVFTAWKHNIQKYPVE